MEHVILLVLPVLGIIFGFALVKGWMDQRAAARSERVRLLEQALQNPAIDRPTIESLTYQLTGTRTQRQGASRTLALVLGLGWLAMFAGIGMWVLGEWWHDTDTLSAGVVTAIGGFGLVTYPFALRELQARRAQ